MTSKYLFIDKYDYLFYCVCVSGICAKKSRKEMQLSTPKEMNQMSSMSMSTIEMGPKNSQESSGLEEGSEEELSGCIRRQKCHNGKMETF